MNIMKNFFRFKKKVNEHSIYSIEAFNTIIKSERSRSDRIRSEFSLIVFDVGEPEKDNTLFRNIMDILYSRIRISDKLGWFDKGSLAVLLPDTSSKGAVMLADMISAEIRAIAPSIKCTVYTYPSQKWFVENGNTKTSFSINEEHMNKKSFLKVKTIL